MESHNQHTYGMVGGGKGAFIGDVHLKAASFDGRARLAAGCFSRDYGKTLESGAALGLARDRLYKSFEEMAAQEAKRPEGIDFAIIVTPNAAHFPAAKALLQSGIHVVCDKPLTLTVEEAEELERLARKKDLLFCVTYLNPGYPIIKHARELVRGGEIGEIRMVMGEYAQGWLADLVEKTGLKVAWRTDPAQAGVSCSVADNGSHLENLVFYVTGLQIEELCAKLDIFGEGRKLDTNGSILLKYKGGAAGMYWSTQIAIGHDNDLRLRVFGTKGAIDWHQEEPNHLRLTMLNGPTQLLSKGSGYLSPAGLKYNRTPPGHPDGTYEAFANVYAAFMNALSRKKRGEKVSLAELEYPDVADGVQGMRFIHKCVESSRVGRWVRM
jgi:predicted dehydrogenase